jgi:hypothetical protein
LLHLLLIQLSLKSVVFLHLLVEHYSYLIDLFWYYIIGSYLIFEAFVLLLQSHYVTLHLREFILLLLSAFLGRLSILLEPIR